MVSRDVLVLGDANPDLVMRMEALDVGGAQREILVEEGRLTLGGSGAIFSAGAARLGLRVGFVGVVGDDLFGRFVTGELEARGVDVSSSVVRSDVATGVSVVLSSPADRTTYTAAGATAALRPGDVDGAGLSASSRHVHVASYFLQDALRPGLGVLLEAARAAGATTSLDPNWDPRERWDRALVEILDLVDVFLPNEAELVAIAGDDDVERASAALAERAGMVVVKRGGAGALARRGDETVRAAAADLDVVDTTGAGDAFDAGFVRAHLEGWSLERALAFANACGALSCRAVGGVDGQPTFDEALALANP